MQLFPGRLNLQSETLHEEYRPRVIVWRLSDHSADNAFVTHECLLTIDSIARTAKPIIVLTGSRLLQRGDLYEIVEYGNAVGLKMIIEAGPEELTDDLLQKFLVFGTKTFRIVLDGRISEDSKTRYRQSPQFRVLQMAVQRLKDAGYELHFSVSVRAADIRALAFYHDYAFRTVADGLYCHLQFDPETGESGRQEIIDAIAGMKGCSPKNMFVSPQCLKYGFVPLDEREDINDQWDSRIRTAEWKQTCLAGRSFAFINPTGKVLMCSGATSPCGDLRINNYNFQEIWKSSELLCTLRKEMRPCAEARSSVHPTEVFKSKENDV